MRGPRRLRPLAGTEGRVYLSTDYEDGPRLDYDTGDDWVRVVGNYDIPSALARTDQPETFSETVVFEEDIVGDLDGRAASADEADHATVADNALALDNRPPSAYVRRTVEEAIEREWQFLESLDLQGGVTVVNGTVDLPQFDGENPPEADREPGSFWFRLDDQPS